MAVPLSQGSTRHRGNALTPTFPTRSVLLRRAVRQDRRRPGGGAGCRPGPWPLRELLAGPRLDAPALRGVLGDVNSALTENFYESEVIAGPVHGIPQIGFLTVSTYLSLSQIT